MDDRETPVSRQAFSEKALPYRLFGFLHLLLFTILLETSFAIKPYTIDHSLPLCYSLPLYRYL